MIFYVPITENIEVLRLEVQKNFFFDTRELKTITMRIFVTLININIGDAFLLNIVDGIYRNVVPFRTFGGDWIRGR